MSYNKYRNIPDTPVNVYSLEDDFKIFKNARQLPSTPYPTYAKWGLVAFCTQGYAKTDQHANAHVLTQNELIIIFPGQLISISEISNDFKADYFTFSINLYNDVLSGLCRFSPFFFFYHRSHYFYNLTDIEVTNFLNYFELIRAKVDSSVNLYKRDFIIHLLRIFFLDVYNIYKLTTKNPKAQLNTHKKELAHNFFLLIMQHYKKHRDVTFYANKLCITPKYLSMVIKEVSGKAAKDWIIEYIIQEIKALLKNSTLNIQEIAMKTNFSNQSSLGRFFKKHTGMSPIEYKKHI